MLCRTKEITHIGTHYTHSIETLVGIIIIIITLYITILCARPLPSPPRLFDIDWDKTSDRYNSPKWCATPSSSWRHVPTRVMCIMVNTQRTRESQFWIMLSQSVYSSRVYGTMHRVIRLTCYTWKLFFFISIYKTVYFHYFFSVIIFFFFNCIQTIF